jgi:hypothetical protein
MRRLLLLTAAAGLALGACGSSKSDTGAAGTTAAGSGTTGAAASATTAAAAAATTAAAGAATTKAAAAATTAAAAATTAAAAAAGTTVTLKEWSVEAPAVKAGSVSFTVKNGGEFPHELKIIKADTFASLAKADGGAVDETKLAADAIVAKTARIEKGQSATLTANLTAGKYVFVCNLGTGAQSHAGKGQHLDVTVS